MKKLIIFFTALIFACSQNAFSAVIYSNIDGEFQEYVNRTGFKILNANEIPVSMTFKYVNKNSMKTYMDKNKKIIYIPKEIMTYVDSEEELGAVLAYQIACCLKYDSSMSILSPKTFQKYADKTSVDLMVKTGYSPIASINILNKTLNEEKNGFFAKEEKKSVRLMNIYEYIVRKYPQKLKDDKLQKNIYYQNFLLNSMKNRELLETRLRHEPNSNKKINYR